MLCVSRVCGTDPCGLVIPHFPLMAPAWGSVNWSPYTHLYSPGEGQFSSSAGPSLFPVICDPKKSCNLFIHYTNLIDAMHFRILFVKVSLLWMGPLYSTENAVLNQEGLKSDLEQKPASPLTSYCSLSETVYSAPKAPGQDTLSPCSLPDLMLPFSPSMKRRKIFFSSLNVFNNYCFQID